MSEISFVTPKCRYPGGDDKIFGANARANQKSGEIGFENVINATVGALLNDDGSLSVMKSAMNHFRSLPDAEISAYAPIAGLPEFRDAAIKACFGDYRPDAHIEAVATPGGSGAIRNTIWNYSDPGDAILTSDWYWGPYDTQSTVNGRRLETYKLFNDSDEFNIDAFREKSAELVETQDRLVILLNSPAHNPTGYSLTDKEWESVMGTINKLAENPDKRIVLFADIAYIDFAGDGSSRGFMKLFGSLPENVLVIVAYSMSKAFTLYGLRSGAMICVSSNKYATEEFFNSCQVANRGTWSNGTRGAQKLLADVYADENLKAEIEWERAYYKTLLEERATSFQKASKEAGLETCPYRHGFFVAIPCDKPNEVAEELENRNIYAVALQKGLRFAVCSVSKDKCAKAPKIIKDAIITVESRKWKVESGKWKEKD
ncbi:MAG: aspartate aminotransferase [Clostridiales bacterium]|nr:MAG: aspartate aminotransferase [Clostridiales bacterium]